jgi:tungstate transport system permease protein
MSIADATSQAFSLLLSGDAELWQIIWISLKTSIIALALASPPAIFAAYFIATYRFRARRFLIFLIQACLSFPTVLIGLLLYLLLSRQGALGSLHWLFAQEGIIIGQILIALPVLTAFALSAIQAADTRLAETATSLGANRWRVMFTVLFEVRFGVMAAIIYGFGRILSEVGCALMVGGNIAGETRTITTAIALETSKGEFALGIALGLVLITLALIMNAALMFLQGDARLSTNQQ